jgi:hypothetical protein
VFEPGTLLLKVPVAPAYVIQKPGTLLLGVEGVAVMAAGVEMIVAVVASLAQVQLTFAAVVLVVALVETISPEGCKLTQRQTAAVLVVALMTQRQTAVVLVVALMTDMLHCVYHV